MKKPSLIQIVAIVVAIFVILVGLFVYMASRHAQSSLSLSEVAPPKNLNELTQINKNPVLNLLHGPLIILSDSANEDVAAQEVYKGTAYVLVQYQDDISGSSTPVLAEPNKVHPVTTMNFFAQGSKAAQGTMNLETIKQAHLALAYYNMNGWLLVTSINNLNYDQLSYDVQNQSIVLQSQDHQEGKNLFGKLKEYA